MIIKKRYIELDVLLYGIAKIYFILFFLLLFTLPVFSQEKSIAKQEQELATLYQQIVVSGSADPSTSDSLGALNKAFSQQMEAFVKNVPESFTYPFDSLTDHLPFTIATSPDSLLRIYSWDNYQGGSMRFYQSLYQYKSNGALHTQLSLSGINQSYHPGTLAYQIEVIHAEDQNYYLVLGSAQYSSMREGIVIQAFEIKDQRLKMIPLFENAEGDRKTALNFNYNLNYKYPGDFLPNTVGIVNEGEQIWIPVTEKEDSVTLKNQAYQFNGKYYEFVKGE